jgi:outer membrane protein
VLYLRTMKIRSFLFASIGLIASTSSSRADDPDDDSSIDGPEAKAEHAVKIQDLLEVAIHLNADLARAKSDRNTAKGEAGGSREGQGVILSASANYERNAINDALPVLPYTSVAEDKISGQVGIGSKVPTGGSWQVDLGLQRTNQEYAVPDITTQSTTMGMQPPDEFVSATQATLSLKLEQPLLRKFGPNIALAPQHKADLALIGATLKAQVAAEDLVKDIVTGYWELAYTAYEVDVRHESLELAKRQDAITHEAIRAGQISPNEAGTVSYEIATREEALLHAQGDWESKSLELRRKVGLEIGRREVVLRPAEAFEITHEEWDINALIEHAKKANRKLAVVAIQRKIADIDVDVAANNELPDITLSASGSLIGGDKFEGNAFSSLASGDGFMVMFGMKFQYEISGAAKANHEAAVAKRHKTDIDRIDQQRQIETQIVAAVHQVDGARARVSLSDKAIAIAEASMRAINTSYIAGKSTTFEVMQKETQLIEARLKRGKAVSDYHVAVAQLQYLSGLILEQYGVNARPKQEK